MTDRPWLALYDDLPADLVLEHPSLLAVLRAGAERDPDRVLLTYFGTDLTLAGTEALAGRVAAGLHERGLRAGDRLALSLQNVPAVPVLMLAAWRCGATVVQVSPLLRAHEVEHALADSGAVGLVTEDRTWAGELAGSLAAQALPLRVSISPLDQASVVEGPLEGIERVAVAGVTSWDELARADGPAPDLAPAATDAAVLTYTSGTTGRSKAAINTHGNVVAGGQVYRSWTTVGADDVVLAIAPLFHITGLTGHLALALTTGARLVLPYRLEPGHALELVERERVTFTVGSITALLAMLHHPGSTTRDCTSLRVVFCGGQPIPVAAADAFEARFGVYVNNAYGMTETTYFTHGVPAGRRAPVDAATGTLSVGFPSSGTSSRVVGEDGTTLPPGELGEVLVRGPGVVPGYWNRPDLTAETMPGGEMRTGDVAYQDADGWLFVVDRKKDMINVSGYKVWPREVEDVLYEHPAVRECAVVGVPDERRGERVQAYVSLVPGGSAEPAELVAFAKERLAAHKYPRDVEVVDEIPKTASGKVLRRAFRETAPGGATP